MRTKAKTRDKYVKDYYDAVFTLSIFLLLYVCVCFMFTVPPQMPGPVDKTGRKIFRKRVRVFPEWGGFEGENDGKVKAKPVGNKPDGKGAKQSFRWGGEGGFWREAVNELIMLFR